MRAITLVSLLLAAAACNGGGKDSGTSATGGGTTADDTGATGATTATTGERASVVGLRIEPEDPTTIDDLSCEWDEVLGASGVTISWFANGSLIDGQGGPVLSSDYTAKAMTLQCEVIPVANDGIPATTEVRIRNTAPELHAVTISPADPTELDSVLTADMDYTDVDNDPLWIYDFHYRWEVNGAEISYDEPALGRAYWRKGDVVSLAGWMRDSSTSNTVWADDVRIGNAPPSAPVVAFSGTLSPGGDLTCAVDEPSVDLDEEDSVAYQQRWRRFGLEIDLELVCEPDQTACTLPALSVEAGASYTCEITPTDGIDEGETGSATAEIDGAVLRYLWRSEYAAGQAADPLLVGDDIDDDGLDDLVVSAPRASVSSTNGGAVLAVGSAAFGDQALVQDAVIRTLYSTETESRFGASVALMSDVDGDGERELVVGAPGLDYGASVDAGGAFVYFSGSWEGDTRAYDTYDQAFLSFNELELTGSAVAAADWDGDGMAELVVGIPDRFDLKEIKGGLMIFPDFSMSAEALLSTVPDAGVAALLGEGQGEGARLATADLSGDGVDELLVQARDAGKLLVIDGAGLAGTFAADEGQQGSVGALIDRITYEIAGAVDEDIGHDMQSVTLDDGSEGLVLTGPAGLAGNGAAYLWRWSDGDVNALALSTRAEGSNNQALGSAVTVLQADGEALIALGAEDDDSTYTGAGAAWLLPLAEWEAEGVVSPGDGSTSWTTVYGESADTAFGASLVTPGDWDGDGLPDLAAGVPQLDYSGVGFDVGGVAVWTDYLGI